MTVVGDATLKRTNAGEWGNKRRVATTADHRFHLFVLFVSELGKILRVGSRYTWAGTGYP